jgi:hypothetical protein
VSTRPPARPRSPLTKPAVLLPVALLVLAALGYGGWMLLAGAEANAARASLLADIDATLAKPQVDGSELSRLMSLLQKQPDHDFARDLLAAAARIELARGRPERAQALFAALAGQPGASPGEQGLGARILLQVQATGSLDRATGNGLLEQVVQWSEAAYAGERRVEDLLVTWQAAERLGRHERSAAAARDLAASHADSAQARFVQFAMAFAPASGVGALDNVVVDLSPAPVEADAMRVFVLLQAGDVPGAAAVAESALTRAPGVGVVRWAAAVVFHACVLGSPEGSDERGRWLQRRDAQLAWLVDTGNIDDARRAQCQKMRDVR